MSDDTQKHTVHTDALFTLGTILNPGDGERDAIHLAVEPVIAGRTLQRGQGINVKGKYAFPAWDDDGHAIVDPFLPSEEVEKGERFWAIVRPRQITSLRHVWSHPEFPEVGAAAPASMVREHGTSVAWVTDFAEQHELTFEELMDAADAYLRRGEYLRGGSNLDGVSTPDEFWLHYCIIRGKEVPEDKQDNFFSCAC